MQTWSQVQPTTNRFRCAEGHQWGPYGVEDPQAGRIMVRFIDPDGGTRAWASGPQEKLQQVRERAAHELEDYRRKKAALGDPLADAEFTEVIEELNS